MVTQLPEAEEPPDSLADPRELLDAYLDFYRATLLRKTAGLAAAELTVSRLPTDWTPLALITHLTWVEYRWLVWGFAGEASDQPWGDAAPDGGWVVPAGASAEDVLTRYRAQAQRSREIVRGVPLSAVARTGGRFATPDDAPTLGWILFHLLQEYARHAGHLDVARELADGVVGE